MPTRWWLPLTGPIEAHPINLHHTHAAFASWLDPLNAAVTDRHPDAEHRSRIKPWFASPVSQASNGSLGIEVSTLTEVTNDFVHAGPPGGSLRLGRVTVRTGPPCVITDADWADLEEPTGRRRWTVAFLTPTCFRLRGASVASPLPAPEAILRGLDNHWTAFSGSKSRLCGHRSPEVIVTRCDIETHLVPIARNSRGQTPSSVPGFIGELVFEAPEGSAAAVEPLFRLIDYVSIGSFARRGLGVARVIAAGKDLGYGRRTLQSDASRRHRPHPPRAVDVSRDGKVRAVG